MKMSEEMKQRRRRQQQQQQGENSKANTKAVILKSEPRALELVPKIFSFNRAAFDLAG